MHCDTPCVSTHLPTGWPPCRRSRSTNTATLASVQSFNTCTQSVFGEPLLEEISGIGPQERKACRYRTGGTPSLDQALTPLAPPSSVRGPSGGPPAMSEPATDAAEPCKTCRGKGYEESPPFMEWEDFATPVLSTIKIRCRRCKGTKHEPTNN